ncbi:putative metal-binding motif-containing protein [Candidatus Woesearchaeota archaeon]|nr:putative metal-binding motif-containing protein [Candidatus Woesearchaeota archaeon]
MLKKALIIFILFLALYPISAVVGQKADIEVNYVLGKGNIQISVRGEHGGSAEFYEGNYTAGDANYVDPIERSKGSALLNCNKAGACDAITFDSVNIFKPGDYYFAVRDKNRVAERRNFYVGLENLLSCDYKGAIIRNNKCVTEFTSNSNDKPLYCSNQKIVSRCAGPGFCGCPSNEQICCTNENIEECSGRLGQCVLPGNGRILEKEIKEGNETVGRESTRGCDVKGVNVLNGICANNVLDLGLSSSDPEFVMQCYCSESDADLDNDGFDSNQFVYGRDCDDSNPGINPLIVESCGPDVNNNNGIDENCDGADLDCSFSCDRDEDKERDANRWYCAGGSDCNDNNANIFSKNEEICEDLIDNDCDKEVDEDCICRIGSEQIIPGVINGAEKCIDGKEWTVVTPANNNPIVFVKAAGNIYESGVVNATANEVFEVEVKFYCPGGNCDARIE